MPPTCRLLSSRPCIRPRTSQGPTVHSTENLARFDRAFDRGPRKNSTCFKNVPNWPNMTQTWPYFFSIENNANTEHETKETEKENVWSTIAEELYCWHVMRGVDTCYVHIVVYILFDRAFDRESRKNSTWFTDDADWSNTTLTWPILCNIIVCLCNEYVWK